MYEHNINNIQWVQNPKSSQPQRLLQYIKIPTIGPLRLLEFANQAGSCRHSYYFFSTGAERVPPCRSREEGPLMLSCMCLWRAVLFLLKTETLRA
jgi:hypothetical protein